MHNPVGAVYDSRRPPEPAYRHGSPITESNRIKLLLIGIALVFMLLVLVLPLVLVFVEEAAISLGATGWQTFWRVTLPNIKWGLLYGVLLCARHG